MKDGGWRRSVCTAASLLVLGGSSGYAFGSAPPALPNAWRTATAQRLADLWRSQPIPGFDAPADPALVSTADAAYALSTRAAGARLVAALPQFRAADGLYAATPDTHSGSAFVTWRAVAALQHLGRLGALRAQWRTLLPAIGALRRPNGYAAQASARGGSVTGTIAAVQLLKVARTAAPSAAERAEARRLLAAAPARALCDATARTISGPAYFADLASVLDTAAVLHKRCVIDARRARTIRVQAHALASRAPGRNPIELILALDTARGYAQLARRGLVDAGDAQRVVTRALRAAASYSAAPRAPAVSGVARVARDAAAAAGRSFRLSARARANLARVVRWNGALPDAAGVPDPVTTAAGVRALRLLGARNPAAAVRAQSRLARLPAVSRVVAQAAIAPARLRRGDAQAVADDTSGDPDLGTLALALTTNRFPLACAGDVRAALRGGVQAELPPNRDFSVAVSTYRLFWVALTVRAGTPCLGSDAGAILGAIGAQLDALRGGDGVYGTRLGQRALVMETWAGLETECLVAGHLHAPTQRGLGRLAATVDPAGGADEVTGRFSVFATFAYLRVRELAAHGCGGHALFQLNNIS